MDRSGVLQGSEGSKNHSLREGDVATGDGEVSGTRRIYIRMQPDADPQQTWEKFPRKERMEMKKIRKITALLLAAVLIVAMAVPALAADTTHSISLKSTDTHTYKVYQVLTGTLSEEGSSQLGNPAWGADAIANPGDVNAFITSITAEGISDQDIAQLVAEKVDTTTNGRGTVDKDHPITDLATGYYVLVDTTTPLTHDGKVDTKALHVVRVVNNIQNMDIKWGTTEQDKEIVSDTLGNGEDANAINGDTDNVSIGDTVNFKITAKIPANANLYNYFYFVINDTLDPGLTLDEDSIAVYKEIYFFIIKYKTVPFLLDYFIHSHKKHLT